MNKILVCLGLMVVSLMAYSQPNMTIWKLDSEHHNHGHEDPIDPPELYTCGSYYYFFVDQPTTSNWSIKNEGDEDLIMELPLVFSIPDQDRFTIPLQPSSNVVPPGEEVFFQLRYENIGEDQNVFLSFPSNDVDNSGCGILIGGTDPVGCQCQCNGANMQETINCQLECTDGTIHLIISDGMCPMEGGACNPISIADPCGCDNTIMFQDQLLFRDTLEVMALQGEQIFLTLNNMDGMVDDINMPIPGGTLLGQVPMSGVLQYVFYRRPGTSVDILINGTPYMSPAPCPEAMDCLAPIPTLSEWGEYILFLLMSIVGLICMRAITNKFTDPKSARF